MKKFLSIILITFSYSFEVANAVGEYGAVASSKKQSSEIGVQILKNGGNAIDAAVAVAFSLAVTHPSAGNIGGGGFMVIRLANGEVTTIDFREKAPLSSFKDMFLDSTGTVIPGKSRYSAQAAGVPGTVYGLGYAHEKYGTLPWDILLYPAIQLAKYGFDLDYHNVRILNSERYKTLLSHDKESMKIFVKDSPFKINEKLIQKDLSNTLSRIAKYGYLEFYQGLTADYIVDCMKRTGGIISHEDLISYKVVERNPIEFDYRGYTIYSMPPPSSGGITLANILNQLELIDLAEYSPRSSEYIHLLVEIEKRAYADRAEYLGDMDFVNIPLDEMISDEYAYDRYSTISHRRATCSKKINHGIINVMEESEETTHFSIVDKYGNSVSLTTTINGWFGNGITVDQAGFLLNNEMDDFSIKPGYPNMYGLIGNEANSIVPEKRMLSSMTPTIVENQDGDLFLVLGSPGGSTIITTVAQILINLIDFNMSLKESVESKRFHHQWLPDVIQTEKYSFNPDLVKSLNKYGHDIKIRSSIGEANCIMLDTLGIKYACSDSRRGGASVAY
ncbi:MAG: gamma-glutamyltransferase [Candidatus Marinimicrobia bacterium]|nr:gamma-glutamyltransferase [Candidatus Neomarinimicrobiota bacterium]|tara:strand:+ start:60834 stop:62513 length:1680 start_codon:yes stop_codon:yes gene_type:complete